MADITVGGAGTLKIPECQVATHCPICGKEIITSDLYRYPIVCDDCKRAVELVKMLYKNKPCWNCKDHQCGVCTKVIAFGG